MENMWAFLAGNLALIIAALAGVALLVVELFMPGFGAAGTGGIALLAGSIAMIWTRYGTEAGLWALLGALILAGIAIIVSLRSARKGEKFRRIWGLKDLERDAPENDLAPFLGRVGVAHTDLRPSGIGNFDEVRLNVVTRGDYIAKGTPLVISHIEGNRIVVERREAQESI